MSGFKDTFTRDDAEENLQYDDAAFYYFFSTMLIIILIPLVWSVIKQMFLKESPINPKFPPGAATSGLNIAEVIAKRERYSGWNLSLFIKVIIIVTLAAFWVRSFEKAGENAPLKSFDPYETLEVPRDSNETDIKRAFRRMSVKYHPDKNRDDPQATARFLLIKKAYDCLVDPEAKLNCEKYGNPDGKGSFNVAIALPSALLSKENHIKVLAVFFFLLVIVVPSLVLCWYSENKKYDIDGLLMDDKKLFFQILNENLIVKNVPRILSCCLDFVPINPLRPDQGNDFKKLHQEVIDIVGKPNLDTRFWKPHHLLTAYMNDIKIGASLQDDLAFMLRTIPKLLEGMIEFSMNLSIMPCPKTFGLRCCQAVIDFSQYFYQGLWVNDSPLLQLGCFEKDTINRITKKVRKLPTFAELVHATNEQRQAFSFIPEENRAAFDKEIENFPNIKVDYLIETNGEKEIVLGDGVTVKITLTRQNAGAKDQDFYYCYSRKFPVKKREKWIIMVADEQKNKLLMQKSTTSGKRVVEEKFEFPIHLLIREEGPVHWKVYVKSDCYKELDQEFDLKFYVYHPNNVKRDDIKLNDEDEKVFREPSFYAKMLNPNAGEEENSDEELEEEEENGKTKKAKRKNSDEELESEEEKEVEISTKKKN